MFTQTPPHHIRIFLSSPGDVWKERELALDVIDKLPYDPLIRGKITMESIAWDKPGAGTPMLAHLPPQEAINEGLAKPSECDIVVVIFWARMGTPLPHPKYHKDDDSRYWSGTEWEYEDALKSARETTQPQIVVYRRMESPPFGSSDPDYKDKQTQFERVKAFFETFSNPDGSIIQGYNQYTTPQEFRELLDLHLRTLIRYHLNTIVRFKEGLVTDKLLDNITKGQYPEKFIRSFVLGRTNEAHLRARALELCFHQGCCDESFLRQVQEDSEDEVRDALVRNIGKYGFAISEDLLQMLMADKNLDIAVEAVEAGATLVEKGVFTSLVLAGASRRKHWQVSRRAIKKIMAIDDADCVAALGGLRNTTYHLNRNDIRKYFERLHEEGRLNGQDREIAIEVLTKFETDGKSSDTSVKRMRRGLDKLQS